MQFYERNSTFRESVHVHTYIVIITQSIHYLCMEPTEVKINQS